MADAQTFDEDMIIFFILTQAAQIIQKNFRGFICRKKLRENKVHKALSRAPGFDFCQFRVEEKQKKDSDEESAFSSVHSNKNYDFA